MLELKQQFANDGQQNQELIKDIAIIFADTFNLYFKTHVFHWNVSGFMFSNLHTLFEEQYNELFLAYDEFAERIRFFGFYAPVTLKELSILTTIKDATTDLDAINMVKELVKDHENLLKLLKKTNELAEKSRDQGTQDLLSRRVVIHEKMLWMLRTICS